MDLRIVARSPEQLLPIPAPMRQTGSLSLLQELRVRQGLLARQALQALQAQPGRRGRQEQLRRSQAPQVQQDQQDQQARQERRALQVLLALQVQLAPHLRFRGQQDRRVRLVRQELLGLESPSRGP